MNSILLQQLISQSEVLKYFCAYTGELDQTIETDAIKLSELIVLEAIRKIQEVGDKSSNDIPFETTDLFVNSLKYHFGVK